MLLIPCGNGAALPGIEGIELLANVRTLVNRLGIGVTQQELRVIVPVMKRSLQGVVVRIGDGPVGGILSIVRALSNARAPHGFSSTGSVSGVFSKRSTTRETET